MGSAKPAPHVHNAEPLLPRRLQAQPSLPVFLAILLGLNLVTLLTVCLVRDRLGTVVGGSGWQERGGTSAWSFVWHKPAAQILQRPEIWACGASTTNADHQNVQSLLPQEDLAELSKLCGRCLYHTLRKAVRVHGAGERVFVATGDIDDMWIRDSSVQMGIYLPRIGRRPALRRILEGAIRTQAFYMLQDPYANSFSSSWRDAQGLSEQDRRLGRGGWVATRNYELDSGAYFINLLWNYYQTANIFGRERFLNETVIYDAVSVMVDTWTVEQRHEDKSPYRYTELDRNGRGADSSYTGMSWSAFRPSDDPQRYGYNIPANMYAAGALDRALQLNLDIWKSPSLSARATRLMAAMRRGIEDYGIVETEDGAMVYAYEVDGLGNALIDFDDPNLPSLLAIPLLGYRSYDPQVHRATVTRLLSSRNAYYYEGPNITGLGSPHTGHQMIWPLSIMVQALVSADPQEKARLLQMLLHHMQCGNGLMHESVNVQSPQYCTRPDFEWANAMLVALYENSVGEDCDAVAEQMRLEAAVAELEPHVQPGYVVGGSVVPQFPNQFGLGMPNPMMLSNPVVHGGQLTVVGAGTNDPYAGIPVAVRNSLAQMTMPLTGMPLALGFPEASPPPPPPPPPERERINPLFFPQLEAEIHYEN